MNIIVRSPNWIGDCIMCLPALRALKYSFPDSNIFLVTKNYLKDIFLNINEIENIITIPNRLNLKNICLVSKKLKKFKFDFGVLFTNSFNSALLFRVSGIKKLFGYRKDFRGFLVYKGVKYPENSKHHTFFYIDLIKKISEKKIGENYSDALVINQDEQAKVKLLLVNHGINLSKPMIGVSPSAAYGSAKEWLPERFKELIIRINRKRPSNQILFFGSEKENFKISKVLAGIRSNVFNLAGKLSLRESIVSISLCSFFLSNDSGLMHIASSLQVPLIAIFGPTIPVKTAPLNKKAKILHHKVKCWPCKYRDCPFDHKCMNAIKVEEVFEEAISFIDDEYKVRI